MSRALAIVATVLLFCAALSLVTAQHRARSLFIDLERAQQAGRQLDIDYERLKIDLSRLAQPAYVEQQARRLGLKPIDASNTVYLNVPAAVAQAPLAPEKKR